jgi:hypothetical protein
VRDSRAREVFYSRLAYVKRAHLDRDLREAARIVLLNGLPDDIYGYDEDGQWFFGSSPLDNQGRREVVLFWRYYFPTGEFAEYAWRWFGANWRAEPLGIVELSAVRRMEQLNMAFFAPTWNGFDSWMEAIK